MLLSSVAAVIVACLFMLPHPRALSGELGQMTTQEFEDFFKRSPLVDGILLRKAGRLYANEYELVGPRTGIDVFSLSMNTDETFLGRMVGFIDRGGYASLVVVRRFRDILRARSNEKVGVIMYTQRHYPLGGSVNPIARWKENGLRMVQLAYGLTDESNQGKGEKLGCGGRSESCGLTRLGQQVVQELNRLRMIIDCSHCNDATAREAALLSRYPIVLTHASSPSLRGRGGQSEATFKVVAKRGGVIGIFPLRRWLTRRSSASIDDYIAHIDSMVRLVGVDHVGFGSDTYIDGSHAHPEKDKTDGLLGSYERWKHVLRKLHYQHGYDEVALRKLMGGNFLRVYKSVLDP